MRQSFRTIYIIANATLSGIYSQNVTWALTLFAAILIVAGNYIFPFNLGESYKATIDISTSAAFMCGTLISIWNSVFAIKQDLNSKTLWTILTKPVSRLEYLLGKSLGVWLATLHAYLIWTPLFIITAWKEYSYQRLSVYIGYNCVCIYALTATIVLLLAFGLQLYARYAQREQGLIISVIARYKWALAALLGATACVLFVTHNPFSSAHNLSPQSAARIQLVALEWRILAVMSALLQLHLITILIGITAAMVGSLPMALIGTLLIGFGIELLPALWIPSLGSWLPLPAADGFRLSEPLTDVLSMQQPISAYWLALLSQSLPWLAFCAGVLMLARYYLGQHDLADG